MTKGELLFSSRKRYNPDETKYVWSRTFEKYEPLKRAGKNEQISYLSYTIALDTNLSDGSQIHNLTPFRLEEKHYKDGKIVSIASVAVFDPHDQRMHFAEYSDFNPNRIFSDDSYEISHSLAPYVHGNLYEDVPLRVNFIRTATFFLRNCVKPNWDFSLPELLSQ
ncbi:MAG: hypothetical protein M1409_01620 [Actinobacteria bacterium]|nr:hypothetical protein [Actinomycetota bacterium]